MTPQSIESPSFFIGKEESGIISFGSGQPDLPPPQAVYQMLPDYKDFKYGLIAGLTKLRGELSKQYAASSEKQFVITNGASEALDLVLRVISKRGRDILLPRPYYYSYPHIVKFAGMRAHYYDLLEGKIDGDSLLKQLRGKTAILINSPSNPTGSVQEIEVLKEIEAFTQKEGIYVISDEVYKDLIYERENYLIGGPRVITINSFSKTYAMCGLRVGYLYVRDQEIVDDVLEMKTHTSMNTNILGQEMAYQAMLVPDAYLDVQVGIWKERRDVIVRGFEELGLSLWKPEGAFYVMPEIKKANKVITDLYYKYKIIAYDGAWFGVPERVRFSYALDKEKIYEGMERLKAYLKKEYQVA